MQSNVSAHSLNGALSEHGGLLDNSEASTLRFDSHQDALNYAAELVKSSNDWLAVDEFDVVERYKKVELEIVLVCRSRPEFDQFHLVLSAIPKMWVGHGEKPSPGQACSVPGKGTPDRDNHSVFIGVGDFVQGPQEVIPSLVRLEPAKQRLDFFRDVLASPDSAHHVASASSERKGTMLGVSYPSGQRNRVHSIVKGTSQADSDVRDSIGDFKRDVLSHTDCLNHVSRFVRVRLHKSFVRMDVLEGVDFPLEINKVFLSPSDLLAGTVEAA